MAELERSLIAWINSNNLRYKCKQLSDLSDGVLLLEFMNQIHAEIFNISGVPREVRDNFALKLGNLNKLKKGLEKYFIEVLRIPHTNLVEHIETSAIARSGDKANMLYLLELVMGAVLNCPVKDAYISRILSLDERSQTELMVFIQKILKKIEKKPAYEEEPAEHRVDVQQLRQENRSLNLQNEELENSLKEIAAQQENLMDERDALKKQLKDLENEIDKKSAKKFPGDMNLTQLEMQVSQKDNTIQELRTQISELKKQNSIEVSTLRDDLDVANEKIMQLGKIEGTLEMYKKRLEDNNVLKKKIQDLEKDNKNFKDKLYQYEQDIAEVESLKQTMNYFKEQHTKEKERVAELTYKLDEREKDMKDLSKYKDDLLQKKTFLENKAREMQYEIESLKYRQDSGRGDEEFSLQKNIIAEYEDQIARLEQDNRKLRSQAGSENIINEINAQLDRVLIEKKNAEEKANNEKRENLETKRDLETLKKEYNTFKEDSNNKISELTSDLNISTENSGKLQKRISELEKDKASLEHVLDDNERLKKERENHLNDMKILFKEKDEVQQKVMEGKEEIHKLMNKITLGEAMLKTAELEKEKLENKLKEALESERLATSELHILKNKTEMTESSVDKIKYLELERDIMKLTSENSSLKLNLREKDDLLSQVNVEKNKKEAELYELLKRNEEEQRKKHDEEIEKIRNELALKNSEIACLQKNREELQISWNKEMKLMSIVLHEAGMEIMRANRTLKDDKSWLNIKKANKN
ncbi:hypothetical protein SteCoe_30993 [Stentor coeruleus]|uniref:Calponin-homology (CH) domain-containing protein n=1 Tax=Stentor coeruleus TaxID=5963 RepID=A0A1R2B2F1_9CILI|nr:hypothetical protein SteCoe_30993 [Stentor coeruleus]